MDTVTASQIAKLEEFFNQHQDTFFHPALKGIFLLGVLCQNLLSIQQAIRGSQPFWSNVKGLRMEQEDFENLYAQIVNKLREYDRDYYPSLKTAISNYLIRAGSNWGFSVDRLNYYFTLGLTLCEEIKTLLNTEKNSKGGKNNE